MISLLRGWLGWALGAVAAGVAVVAAIVTTGNFPGSDPDPSEPPAEIAALPDEASEPADAPEALEEPVVEAPADAPDTPQDEAAAPNASETAPDDGAEATPDSTDTSESAESTPEVSETPELVEEDMAATESQPPLFGNIRFPAKGVAVVAGQAAPGQEVVVFLDGEEVASVIANAAGDFAALFDLALSGVPRVVRIATRPDDGQLVFAEDSRIVEPRQAPVQVAKAEDAPADEAAQATEAPVDDTREMAMAETTPDETPMPDATAEDAPIEMADAGQAAAPDQPEAPGSTGEPPTTPAEMAEPDTDMASADTAEPGMDMAAADTAEPGPDMTPEMDDAPNETGGSEAGTAPQVADVTPTGEMPAEADMAEATPAPVAPTETPTAIPSEEAAEVAAADLAEETPRVLRADRDGIRVIEELRPADMPDLSLDAIAYDDAGEVTISGRGEGGQQVRLYLDNALVGDATVGPDGQWRLTLPESVEPGIYTMRVDEIGPDGGVTARVESPFKREDPEMLVAALNQRTGGAAQAPATPATPATPAMDEPRDIPGDVDPVGEVTVDQPDGREAPVAQDPDTSSEMADMPDPTGDAPEVSEVAMAEAPQAPGEGDAVAPEVEADAPATDTAPAIQTADTAPEAPAPEPMISAITVQPGSTLWAISRERYGDGLLYVQVFEANRDKIRDPDLIYPGQVFELPTDVSAQ